MAVVEPSFFHIPLWILTGDVLVFLAAAYQPLDGMPTRVRREVTPPIPNTRVIISIHASYQAQSLLGQVRHATKHTQSVPSLQAAYQTDPCLLSLSYVLYHTHSPSQARAASSS
jgi:hypothetical protein